MEKELNYYLEIINNSFLTRYGDKDVVNEWGLETNKNFKNGLRIDIGKTYVKIMSGRSVHSFVVLVDDNKFKRGDILKSTNQNKPVRNFSRGNIFVPSSFFETVSWMRF